MGHYYDMDYSLTSTAAASTAAAVVHEVDCASSTEQNVCGTLAGDSTRIAGSEPAQTDVTAMGQTAATPIAEIVMVSSEIPTANDNMSTDQQNSSDELTQQGEFPASVISYISSHARECQGDNTQSARGLDRTSLQVDQHGADKTFVEISIRAANIEPSSNDPETISLSQQAWAPTHANTSVVLPTSAIDDADHFSPNRESEGVANDHGSFDEQSAPQRSRHFFSAAEAPEPLSSPRTQHIAENQYDSSKVSQPQPAVGSFASSVSVAGSRMDVDINGEILDLMEARSDIISEASIHVAHETDANDKSGDANDGYPVEPPVERPMLGDDVETLKDMLDVMRAHNYREHFDLFPSEQVSGDQSVVRQIVRHPAPHSRTLDHAIAHVARYNRELAGHRLRRLPYYDADTGTYQYNGRAVASEETRVVCSKYCKNSASDVRSESNLRSHHAHFTFPWEDDDGRLAYSTPRWPLQVTSKPATVTVAGIPTHYAAPGFKSQVIKVFSGLDFTLLEAAKGRQRKSHKRAGHVIDSKKHKGAKRPRIEDHQDSQGPSVGLWHTPHHFPNGVASLHAQTVHHEPQEPVMTLLDNNLVRIRTLTKAEFAHGPTAPYICLLCVGREYRYAKALVNHVQSAHNCRVDYITHTSDSPADNAEGSLRAVSKPPPTTHQIQQQATHSNVQPRDDCDFCLGTAQRNKDGRPEMLISCAKCGHSGHPSCLQFSSELTAVVMTYPWLCLECKHCCVCQRTDDEDNLLCCDGCDQGYHLYCLTPALDEPPEGTWLCPECVVKAGQVPHQSGASADSGAMGQTADDWQAERLAEHAIAREESGNARSSQKKASRKPKGVAWPVICPPFHGFAIDLDEGEPMNEETATRILEDADRPHARSIGTLHISS